MGAVAAVGAIASVVGNVLGAVGESEQAKAQAEVDRRNEILAEYNAQDAERRGAAEAGRIRMKGSQVQAEARVATAASGIELTSPVAQRVAGTTAAFTALDALTAKSNAAREAWGYRSEGEQYKKHAEQMRRKSMIQPFGMFFGGKSGTAF
jgi:hypothetical protein